MRRLRLSTIFPVFVLLFAATRAGAQPLVSGDYGYGLKLAYDSSTREVTGYFEDYTGWDEATKSHPFSCVFFFRGILTGPTITIRSFYPEYPKEVIGGTLLRAEKNSVYLKLAEEHGGCWNVRHFAGKPQRFDLEKRADWTRIGYVTTAKAYFYKAPSEAQKQKAYLVRFDFVCVGRRQGAWAYCTYFGTRVSKGWVKLSDLDAAN